MEQKLRGDREIGSNLKFLREKHNISQEKLCSLLQRCGCDIGRSAYAKYENGELNIKVSVLKNYAKYMVAHMMIFLRDWILKNEEDSHLGQREIITKMVMIQV